MLSVSPAPTNTQAATVPYEQFAQVRQELQELRNWKQATISALGNGHFEPGARLTTFFTSIAYEREQARGVEAPNHELPIARGWISRLSGQSRDSVRRHMAQLVELQLVATRTDPAEPEWATAADGTRTKTFTQQSYIAIEDGSPTKLLRRFAQASPVKTASRGGSHEREAERDDAGHFLPSCRSCHAHGTLVERKSLVCTSCGSVFEQHGPRKQNRPEKRPASPPPQDVVVPPPEIPKSSMPQVAASIHTKDSAPPPAPPSEPATDPQISGENNGHEARPNVKALSMPQSKPSIRDGALAVLDVGVLHVARAGRVESYPASGGQSLAHLLDHAAKGGIDQLWIAPAWVEAAGLPAHIDSSSHEHTFVTAATEAGWTLRPGGLARWISARRTREHGYDAVYIGLPGFDNETELRNATNGRTLLDALVYFERATRQRYLGHPLRTSSRILKTSNPGKPLAPIELPECAEDRRLEWDYAFLSPPSLEETDGRYIHCFDRNAAYLSVCSSLTVGAGKLYHAPSVPAIDPKRPGYYLARIENRSDYPSGYVPDPFHDQHHRPGEWHWRTAQTVGLAVELGAAIECREAWLSGQSSRPLERWYLRLRDARYGLEDASKYPNREAAELARGMVKSCYTRMSGRLASHLPVKDDEALHRPDIRHAIIAATRANMHRTILQCAAVERAPVVADVDALYFLSDSPDAVADCPAPLELSPRLGKWKHAGSWPAGEFCAAMWKQGATVKSVLKAARDIDNERPRG